MKSRKDNSSGFTLITTLILLFLLSALSIGMLMMVNSELKVSTHDVQNNFTFHAAEGAIEKMTADISNLFQNTLSPQPADLTNLATNPGPPSIPGITFPAGGYTISPVLDPVTGLMKQTPSTVSSGPYAGLNAQLLQVNLQATAQGLLGDEVQMSRAVEVAMIPVFQFGAFSDGDIAFFDNPTLTFNGRIHTNGDLYLGCAGSNTCTFTDRLTAYGNVIRANIPNGVASGSANNLGSVEIPGGPNGCTASFGKPQCTVLPTSGNLWGSVTGAGGNPPVSSYNSSPDWVTQISEAKWTSSKKYLGGMLLDGNYGKNPNSGATDLTLPFVSGATLSATPGLGIGAQNYEIVRRAPPGELTTSPLGASRLYNEAAIRVLLSDQPDELPGGVNDPDNVRLANVKNPHGTGTDFDKGVATLQPNLPVVPATNPYVTYFATASALAPTGGIASPSSASSGAYSASADWLFAPISTAGEFNQEFDTQDETTNGTQPAGFPYLFNNGPSQSAAPNPVVLCTDRKNNATCNTTYPYFTPPQLAQNGNANDTQWNLVDGYLRVEYLPANGNCPGPGANINGYCAITREWLQLGFARDTAPPTAPAVPYSACTSANISATSNYTNLYNTKCSNDVNPYAILIFQQPKRDTAGPADPVGSSPKCTKITSTKYTCTGYTPDIVTDYDTGEPYQSLYKPSGLNTRPTVTAFNWYPINFYDTREGEGDDIIQGDSSCTPMGVMNAVELDVGNLNQWLKGNIPGSGSLVNYTNQNGYILYFSDRRGMLPNPNGTQTIAGGNNPQLNITGDAGFEDVVNRGSGSRAPDGILEPAPAGRKLSPEDANLNGIVDNFGAKNLGLGLGYIGGAYIAGNSVNKTINASATKPDPYLTSTVNRISSCSISRNAWVSGARHVLKLVDGSLGNLPTVPGGAFPTSSGGFTVGSENPVYVVGNYNSNCRAAGTTCTPGNTTYDTNWPTPPTVESATDPFHAAASIVADTVTLLSNSWADWNSILNSPTQPCSGAGSGCSIGAGLNRSATNGGYYRTAIATGDVQAFSKPSTWGTTYSGTDGGMGNFLRMLEVWDNQTLNYNGSMVNLFYSTYNTGLFKCCNYSVYIPPTRNYNFDASFNTFSELPPGTPMFRDINNLSYRQTLTPCIAVGSNNNCSD
ncbi:MAG TPA: hypothetical protein VH596_06325 [Terriglobales bacterium]|jgi:hypothetical protein